ncbi:glutaredoxin family protein [Uliginosibacterium sp. sgz301328]|uniref:glutaredoxin family protein n=1 Tax=Uliginosibacterium sp. sgz301328 TaxID=3243764 RepID=UPI00359DF689
MYRTTVGFVCVMLALVAASVASAEVYRWVDKNGKVNYSDNPPPDANIEQRKLNDNKMGADKLSFETRRAMETFPVTLYTNPDCKEFCDKARALLAARKVPYSENSVVTQDQIDALLKLTGNKEPRVPVLTVGRKTIDGLEPNSWNAALDSAGYPK